MSEKLASYLHDIYDNFLFLSCQVSHCCILQSLHLDKTEAYLSPMANCLVSSSIMLASRDRSLQVSTGIMNADSVTQLGGIFNHRISLQSSKVMTLAFYAGGIYVISLAKTSKGDNPFLMLWFLFVFVC